MSNWLDILEQTAAAIDASQKVGSDSPSGKRLVRTMERRLRGYFQKIRSSFPMDRVIARYELLVPPVLQESVERITEQTIEEEFLLLFSNWLNAEDPLLAFIFADSIANGNASGFEGTLGEWLDVFGLQPPEGVELETFIPQSVIDKARVEAAAKVVGADEETIKRLSKQIADALENRSTSADLAKVIAETFDSMTDARAKLIAQTELNIAINDGTKEANLAVGADEKEWIQTFAAKEPRAVHTANMADGRIPIGRPFSGDGSMDAGSGNNNIWNCHCTTTYFGATEDAVAKLLGLAA